MFFKSVNWKSRIIVLVILFTGATFLASCNRGLSKKSAAETPVKVAVVTGGHGFKRAEFFSMFDSFEGIEYVEAAQKDDSEIFEDASNVGACDVIVLYNMSQKISQKRQQNFIDILNKGKGLVVVHHAMASFADWQEYEKIAGARYFLKESVIDGKTYPGSTYKHGVDMQVKVSKKRHPVTKGLEDFDIHDETYKGCYFEDDNNVLLTTDEATSDKAIAWTREYGKSRVCFIQLGHGPEAYANESYRKLLSQAIRWSAVKN